MIRSVIQMRIPIEMELGVRKRHRPLLFAYTPVAKVPQNKAIFVASID